VTGRRSHPFRRRPGVALVTAFALAAAAAAVAPALAHGNGDKVEITGVVTGPDGRPLDGVQVQLEASRSEFSFRRFQRVTTHTARLTALTDEGGRYTLEWPWNSYFNSFELAVGVPVRRPGGERFEALERVDITQRIKKASPVVVAVVVQNAEFVAALRKFLAGIDSEDERRVYRDLGKPDKVEERVDAAGGGRAEATWWYFESGQAYRFRDGVLEGVDRFDPVKGF
jgi:hypothetical protein